LSYSYKQIATHYGYSKWTIEEIKKESESECEKALDKKIK
jgi:transposase